MALDWLRTADGCPQYNGSKMSRFCPAILLLCIVPVSLGAEEPALTQSQGDFFEQKIRPVLIKHCYQCHSDEAKGQNQLKGGLLVDSREGLRVGGDSGAAVVPNQPAESLLLEALHYGDMKMPPKGKLPDAIIADFETWIAMGAPDPRDGKGPVKAPGIDLEAGRKHWAYQPVHVTALPDVNQTDWPSNAIDRYILKELESKSLQPGPDANKVELIRRLYFDLIGLPPTPEQIDAFVNDPSSDAYERLVDELLSSTHYGERWGRHWLDVARYADSLTLRGFIFPDAWRYRDYVIESFNRDRPFDRFIQEQIAGDLLPVDPAGESLDEKQRRLVATTFLILGNTNLEEQDKAQLRMDVVDEQLDVISKGLLGQTVTCARCHDHKFDPIPTRDYYALAGILRNSKSLEHSNVSKWLEFPLPVEPELEQKFRSHEVAVADLQNQIKKLKDELKALVSIPTSRGPEVVAANQFPGVVVDDSQAKKVGEWKFSQYSKRYVGEGYIHDLNQEKGGKTLTFQPELPKGGVYEVRLAYSHGESRSTEVPVTIFSADGEKTVKINQRILPPIDARFVSLGQYKFEQNGQGFVIVANEDTQGHVTADAVQFLPLEMLDAALSKPQDSPAKSAESKASNPLLEQKQKELPQLEKQLKELTASGPKRPMFMSVQEEQKIEDCEVHIRGTVHNLGEKVPRGFLQVASWSDAPAFYSNGQSGRLELAAWIADRRNPLTSRVMANRVWHWLMGSGVVRTTDNFGTTGEAPSHPELLDYLANQLVDQGWSVKSLVRLIVLSRTYRLSSRGAADLVRVDPENRLFGRASRRRLDAECLLDSILSVSGQLDSQVGSPTIRPGTSSDFGYEFNLTRRAVYWPVMRNSLPEIFEAFDFPDPSMVSGRRNVSTVAPQALYLMNNPFVAKQAQKAAERLLESTDRSLEQNVDMLFRRTLGRLPTEVERNKAIQYVTLEIGVDSKDAATETVKRLSQLAQALFGTMDFRYVD